MKRFLFILCIITFSIILCSCQAVKMTAADELVSTCWFVENPSTVSSQLSFDITNNKATLKITDQNGEEVSISGVYAVDNKKLYITSESLARTYSFGYTVFKDRLLLTYNDTELTFFAEKEKEP